MREEVNLPTKENTLTPGVYELSIRVFTSTTASVGLDGILRVTISPNIPAGTAFHWINPAGGSYGVAANWDPPQVPVHNAQRSDTAIFDLMAGGPPVAINAANATAGNWSVQNLLFQFTGPAEVFSLLTLENGGFLTLVGGTLTSRDTVIGLDNTRL